MKAALRFLVFGLLAICSSGFAHAKGVIVRLSDSSLAASLLFDYPEIEGIEQPGNLPFVRFEVYQCSGHAFVDMLQFDSRVLWAEEEAPLRAPVTQSSHGSSVAAIYDRSETYSENKGLWTQINFITPVRSLQAARVGIVDTGVSHLQPSILSNVIAGQSFIYGSSTIDDFPTNLDTNDNGVLDEGAGHGTMIAGLILQMNPSTPLVIAKAADSDGVGTSWSVMLGVLYCLENQAKVINISLGSPDELPGFTEFLNWVETQGVAIVSPIGNDGENRTLYPAGYSNVICVAGLLPDNTKAPFSNWFPVARVAAPATGILSAWYDGGTAVWSGTSLSAPLVTGSLASALSQVPNASPQQLRIALSESGRDIDHLNPNYQGELGKLLDYLALIAYLRHDPTP